jgi:hypothetical protein
MARSEPPLSPNAREVWRYIRLHGWVRLDDDPPASLSASYEGMNEGAYELRQAGLADIVDGPIDVILAPIWAPGIYMRTNSIVRNANVRRRRC